MGAFSLAAVLVLGNWPLLSARHVPRWDAVDFFEPSFTLVGDALRAGQLLKWDPWSGGGAPAWVEPELGTTSPVLLTATALPLSPRRGYVLYWFAVWMFAGLGMLLLAKHAGCSPSGATIAACGFVASGFFTGHAEHVSSVYSVSFLPWILWRFDVGLERRDWQCGVQAGLLYGVSALGGYPEFTILTPGFLALWAVGRTFAWPRAPRLESRQNVRFPAIITFGAVLIVGALVMCTPYSGLLLRTRGYSDHLGPRVRETAISSNLLPAGALSTLASPYLANLNLPPHPLWPSTDISMTSVYTGAATLVFAAFALRRIRSRWSLAAIAALFLCCALGSQLPLRGWLYDLVPPTRYFRNPSLFRAYFILVVCFLAALGASDLREARLAERVRFWRLSAVSGLCALVVFEWVSRTAGKFSPFERMGVAHLCMVWFGLGALSYFWKANRANARYFWGLAAALACLDAVGALIISRPTISDSPLPWLVAANIAHNPDMDLTHAGLARDLLPLPSLGPANNDRNTMIKEAVLENYLTAQVLTNRFQHEMITDPALSRMATGASRIWFSAAPVWVSPERSVFTQFQRRVHELDARPVLVLHSPQQMLGLPGENTPEAPATGIPEVLDAAPCIPAPVTNLIYKPNLISFRYDAPSQGYLLVTDRWADGWQATVNGQSTPVLGGDFIYRAIQVGAGPNLVQFRYEPAGFRPLVAISWGTLLVLALWQCRKLLPG